GRGDVDRGRLPRRRPPRLHARRARVLRARGSVGRRAPRDARSGHGLKSEFLPVRRVSTVAPLELTTNQQGAIAKTAVVKATLEYGLDVYRPVAEGGRYDLIFGLDDRLLRVQCKWAQVYRDVLVVRCFTSRRTRTGVVRRRSTLDEVDAIAAYCAQL